MRTLLTQLTVASILIGLAGCGDFDTFDRRRSAGNTTSPDRRIIINQGSGSNPGGTQPQPGTQPDGGGAPQSDGAVAPHPPPQQPDSGVQPKPDTGPPPSTAPCGFNAFETDVFNLVNKERASRGLTAYQCDTKAGKVARDYSALMCSTGHFSHTGPDGSSPWTRLKAGGVSYQTAGENIAAGQTTPASVMNSWMNSSGHRAAILSTSFAFIGVGYAYCNNGYKHYWTQTFFK